MCDALILSGKHLCKAAHMIGFVLGLIYTLLCTLQTAVSGYTPLHSTSDAFQVV